MSKIKATQNVGINTHRAWIDAVTIMPLPAMVIGISGNMNSTPQHNVLFANSLCISMLARDMASLRSAALGDLFTEPVLAKKLASSLATGCQFRDSFNDPFISSGGNLTLVSFPVTDMSERAPLVANLLVFLQGETANIAAVPLRSMVTADSLAAADFNVQKVNSDATIRVGLCAAAAAGQSQTVAEEEAAPHHAVITAAYESALSNRLSGKRPISSLPSAAAYDQWLTYFQQCLTSTPAR
jgi:hypothetical protein